MGRKRRGGAHSLVGASGSVQPVTPVSSSCHALPSPSRGKGEPPRPLRDLTLGRGSEAALGTTESELDGAETAQGRAFTRVGVGVCAARYTGLEQLSCSSIAQSWEGRAAEADAMACSDADPRAAAARREHASKR